MRDARIRTGAALVVLALGASCSDDEAAEPALEARSGAPTTLAAVASADDVDDDAPTTSQTPIGESTTPTMAPVDTPVARDAVEVAIGFLDAYGAFDADRALSYLTEEAIDDARPVEFARTPEEFRRELAMYEAFRYRHTITACEQTGESPSGTTVRCAFDLDEFGSDEVGLGPYTDNYWELTVRDGRLTSALSSWAFETNGSSTERWGPFAGWMRTNYPHEVLSFYTDDSQHQFVNTAEAVPLLERRVNEFVAEERDRLESATAFVHAWIAGDGDAAGAVLAPDGTWEDVAAGDLPALLDWLRAVGADYRSDGCRLRPAMGDVECPYSVDNDLTRFLGVGPIANRFVVEVAGGAITEVNDVPNEQARSGVVDVRRLGGGEPS